MQNSSTSRHQIAAPCQVKICKNGLTFVAAIRRAEIRRRRSKESASPRTPVFIFIAYSRHAGMRRELGTMISDPRTIFYKPLVGAASADQKCAF